MAVLEFDNPIASYKSLLRSSADWAISCVVVVPPPTLDGGRARISLIQKSCGGSYTINVYNHSIYEF